MKKFCNVLFYMSSKKALTIGFLVLCVGYTAWYMMLSDPLEGYGALSYIGLEHPVLFSICGLLTEFALLLNVGKMFLKFGYRNKYATALLMLGILSMIITICVPFNYDNKFQFVVHCYGAISFIVYNGSSMIFFFIQNRKIKKLFLATAIVIGAIMLITLVLFATIGESGALEVTPLIVSFAILFVANYTKMYEPLHVKIEPKAILYEENNSDFLHR